MIEGEILIPGFIRSPSTLAVNDVSRRFLVGATGRDFPSVRIKSEGISHTCPSILRAWKIIERGNEVRYLDSFKSLHLNTIY